MTTLLHEPLSALVKASGELGRLLSAQEGSPRLPLLKRLLEIARAIEACPSFTLAEMCYFRNRLASCRRLLGQGEWGAFRYEITEMSRKLARANC